jgi:phosphoglycolate phosphatase
VYADDVDAVVYDLDGTLVRLAVDWEAVETEVGRVLSDAGVDPDDHDSWGLLDAAQAAGVGDDVDAIIARHERDGAVRSERLPAADDLPLDRAVGVCSLNCEAAVRAALDHHGLAEHVQAVVGRDTVAERKPHPQPLLETVRALGVDPARVLFVGDSPRDEETAVAAGTMYAYVGEHRQPD